MIRALLSATALFVLFAVPSVTAGAQASEPSPTRTNTNDGLAAKQAGITHAALQEHTRQVAAVEAGTTTALTQTRSRRGQTLMIVGGAAFLAGLIIGDDAGTAIAIGGALIGIYGLYLWAQ